MNIEALLLVSSLLLVLIISQIVFIVAVFRVIRSIQDKSEINRMEMMKNISETQQLFKVEVTNILSHIKNLLK